MPDAVGRLDTRVEIWRSAAEDGPGGRRVGPPALLATRWASCIADRGTTALEGTQPVDRADLVVTMRTDGVTRTITVEDRLVIAGRTYALRTVELPNRLTGRIRMTAVAEARGAP